jgi:hypothetical protein
MLAISDVAAIAIDEILATRRMPREAGVRLSTTVDPVWGGEHRGAAVQMEVAVAPEEGDAVLALVPVFVEADTAPLLDQKLLDADVSSERVQFTLRSQV